MVKYTLQKLKKRIFIKPIGMKGGMDDGKSLTFDYKGRKIKFVYHTREQKSLSYGYFKEIFLDEAYQKLDVRGSTVMDLGASVGDTAIYFMLNGADRVIAYEINGDLARLASENVEANGLSKIQIINSKVPSLEELLRTVREDEKIALKSDFEGGEYDLILNAMKEELERFSNMIIEYHHGPEKLVKHLSFAGFKCETRRLEGRGDKELGVIYASR